LAWRKALLPSTHRYPTSLTSQVDPDAVWRGITVDSNAMMMDRLFRERESRHRRG
jgi:hypothetical protein